MKKEKTIDCVAFEEFSAQQKLGYYKRKRKFLFLKALVRSEISMGGGASKEQKKLVEGVLMLLHVTLCFLFRPDAPAGASKKDIVDIVVPKKEDINVSTNETSYLCLLFETLPMYE